jgi:hypothetical protein
MDERGFNIGCSGGENPVNPRQNRFAACAGSGMIARFRAGRDGGATFFHFWRFA